MNLVPSLLALGTQLILVSDNVPTLNVAASCRAVAAIQLADSQNYDACMRDENSARDELVKSWQSFSASERTRCIGEASTGGIDSYVDLLCVCKWLATPPPSKRSSSKAHDRRSSRRRRNSFLPMHARRRRAATPLAAGRRNAQNWRCCRSDRNGRHSKHIARAARPGGQSNA